MTNVPPPHRFRFADEAKTILVADWRDDHVSAYPLAYLRGWCPCAECQGHVSEHSWVEPKDTKLTAIQPVGAYAIALAWGDGHGTGIHPFAALRAMCPCEACGGPLKGTPEDVAAACRAAASAGPRA